ncbi:1-deoxy-D-xylulose-5-phosphate reductoisomerase [Helicobacter cappadocius]|uniref:1-deoxy-D-xylulose 5-phosphate reductoisomerase n=1 Tax=Helicobacter cappadocius TaxID=3063998 RepID=A0AA90TBB5_9HELI|nr:MULTISPECIES: 1-deoxy-D-xylulose-5-phosphate reductoisomerase [unclassified Helicobacter]MDO7252773.1 1-deoxy-D-xylulose-5-phosphate reductoisomerase [Helicobacter sp. faydin-H75]MDP2538641.1 1-deoxy-D-xylulose-5-phosphate reductoisomerase [Helicobacter sp. faydin-H76]
MILLGSTGSIGVNTLIMAQKFNIKVESLSAGRNIELLNSQIAKYRPKKIAIIHEEDIHKLTPQGAKIYVGNEGICEMIAESSSSLVVNAIVGFGGLDPTLTALKYNKKLALANKESLVIGGWMIDASKIIPIDSEHFGLWYLSGSRPIKKLIITASGGAFRDISSKEIPTKKPIDALKHPNWKMGKKITIDSASMVNKLFEILEAKWLFRYDEIEAYIERSSNIHALIEFLDGSLVAHFATPDMKLPIAYALDTLQAKNTPVIDGIDILNIPPIKFEPIDIKKYPLWELKESLIKNPKLGIVLNASNEIAVEYFLNHKINFGNISSIVLKSIERFDREVNRVQNKNDISEIDKEVREFSKSLI